MSLWTKIGSSFYEIEGGDLALKKAFGKAHTSTDLELYAENMSSSMRVPSVKVISGTFPGNVADLTSVAVATANGIMIQTGSTVVADLPAGGGGRVYCMMDSADTSGKTWVTVLTGAFNVVSSRGTQFCSTGSDRDFILTDWIAPWHTTGASGDLSDYQPKVYAVWKSPGSTGGSVTNGPDTITEISASNKLAWVFNPEAGVLRFANPTLTFSFQNFITFEENLATLTDYTDNGWNILSQTKTTTEHVVVLGGGWASGSLASPTWRPLSDIITAHTGATTSSCIAVAGYRHIGRSIYLG